ncbi:MAG: DNA-methyltransferase [Thermoguttaceae bacterium]
MKIYNCDCISGMQKLHTGCVDLVFADPPFNIGYEYDKYKDNRSEEDYLDWSEKWMREVYRLLKDDGTFWLAIGDDFAAELKVCAKRNIGFTCRSWVIWYYTFGVNCSKKFTRSHTHLFHFVKNPKQFTFNDMEIRVPSARQLVYADKRANSKGRLPDDTWIIPPESVKWTLRPHDLPDAFTPAEDVCFFPRVCGTFKERTGWHSCQMPEQLLGRIIRVSSNPGETVLDPFLGSGSTVCVAKKLGRDYMGYEISDDYYAAVKERLGQINVGDPLIGTENPLTSVKTTEKGRKLSELDENRPVRKRIVKRPTKS